MRNPLVYLVVVMVLLAPQAMKAEALGPEYQSLSMGLSIRPPEGCLVHKPADPESLLTFANEGRKWNLRITRTLLGQPMVLGEKDSAEAPETKAGPKARSFMELAVEQFTAAAPEAQVVRQEEMILSKRRVGLLAFRHNIVSDNRFTQQAIIQRTRQLYYIVELTTPGAKPNAATEDSREAEARAVFARMLGTVQLLDQSDVRADQDQRLFRTRSLFLGLTEPVLSKALAPETYLRHIKDGKDAGYSYQVEEPVESAGQKGFHIGIRSRMIEAGKQIDSEAWLFSSWDRRHEDFSHIVITDAGKEKSTENELGVSNREVQRRLDRADAEVDQKDPKNPRMRESEKASLSVTLFSNTRRLPPIEKTLSVFYIPQALDHLLPRVAPLEARTYLVQTWVSDRQNVMLEYIDVGHEEMTMLGDRTVRGVPVRMKIGLEGSVTTTYVSREGKFLGRINEEEKTMTLPSTEQELTAIWKNADLSRPKPVGAK